MEIIYSGVTKNNIFIDDMIDKNNDRVFSFNHGKSFIRLCGYRKEANSEQLPALAVFDTSDGYNPIYGKPLDNEWAKYLDNYGRHTTLLISEVEHFKNDYLQFLKGGKADELLSI